MSTAQMSDLMFRIVGNDNSRAAFDSASRNADGFSRKAGAAGREAAKSIDVAKGSVSNLAAQFNDIGVQLSGGQSPFLIALQQGSQIGQVLGPMGAGGAVRSLGAAFLSLLSPVNLATIGLIAVGGAAVQYFSGLLSDGEDAATVLEKQSELISSVAARWGDAVPALKDYVDQLERAKDQSDLVKATDALAGQQWDVARRDVSALNDELAVLVGDLRQAGAEDTTILALQSAWNELSTSVKAGEENTAAMREVQDALASALNETGIPAVSAFSTAFSGLSDTIAGAVRQAQALRTEALNALTTGKNGPALGALSPLFSDNGQIYSSSNFIPGTVPVPGTNPLRNQSLNNEDIYGGPKRTRTGKSEEERQAENIQKVIQSLEDEVSMVGKSKAEQRALQLQRRANVDAASVEGQTIANLVAQIDKEQQAYREAKAAGDFMRDNLKQSFADVIPEIETGNKALDGFINRLIQASAEALFFGDGPLSGMFGTSKSGGLLGSIFGGGRAVGGGVDPWHDYLVGENGPEIVRIGARGGVVGQAASDTGKGGGAPHVTVGVSVDDEGNLKAYVKSVAQSEGSSAATAAVSNYDKQMPARVQQINNNPRRR